MKKDRVVIKDYTLSVLSAGLIGALIVMVFIPIMMYTIGRQIGMEDLPIVSVFFSGTLESISVIEIITHIVLGALVLQYMRLYMFMGLTRDRAFLRLMMVEGITLIVTFLFLMIIGIISSLIAGSLVFSSLFKTCFYITLTCVLAFGIGCVSSALSTTCRPPLSVGVVIAFLFAMSWLFSKAASLAQETIQISNGIQIVLKSNETSSEAIIACIFGLVMSLIAYLVYKLPISQMKSTAIN